VKNTTITIVSRTANHRALYNYGGSFFGIGMDFN